jgi:membrane fusion protein, multidrug efflux system
VLRSLAFAVLLVVASPLGCGGNVASKAEPAPPPEVTFETVQPEDVPIHVDSVGTVDGLVNAEIRARVPGYVLTQDYRDGTHVERGQLLFTIDASLTQAQAKKARGDEAAAKAALAKTVLDLNRVVALSAEGLASKQEVDNATAAKQLAAANVLAAQGSLDTAGANLSFSQIRAPISGLAGIAKVRVGSLVGQGDATLLTTISQIDQVRVSYTISERWYLSDPKKFQVLPGEAGPSVDLFLADGARYPESGHVTFIDRQVDPSTGTLTVMATFPNPEGLLRPGLYAKVRDVRDVRKGVICVPQRAVAELQGSPQVVVIGAGEKAELRPVVMGQRVGSRWIVESGLKPGERIVVEGLQKVRAGAVVAPRPATSGSAAPKGS